jgi:hypothetical protein
MDDKATLAAGFIGALEIVPGGGFVVVADEAFV